MDFNLTLKSRQVFVGGSHLFWKEYCFTIPAPFASIKQALHPSVSAPSGDEITVIGPSFFPLPVGKQCLVSYMTAYT